VIPADGLLVKGPAMVDYSFVTGESKPQQVQIGELLYAGGRQVGQSIMIRLHRTVSQSYLTSLWEQHHGKFDQKKVSFSHALARNFTYILLVVVGLTAIFWWYMDPHKVFNAITAMLIIACPCALLLAVTFTSGTIQGIMAKNGLYIRSATVLEQMAETDTIIFDKTGTITGKQHKEVTYKGMALDMPVMSALYALSSQSAHPLSKGVAEYLYQKMAMTDTSDDDPASIRYFKELTGKGIEAQVNGWRIKMGSFHFVSVPDDVQHSGGVFYSIDGQYGGHFEIKTAYRPGLNKMIQTLSNRFKLGLISGDKADDKAYISHIFPKGSDLLFEQLPEGKSHYIESLQSNGQRVLMLGDGLNDAIALSRAHTGIAITDDTNLFSPACDAILVGNQFQQLPALIRLAKVSRSIIITTFIVSIMYNIVGLYFAVQGLLTPLQAAIIMPSMTASIVLITTVSGRIFASYYGLKK
jgi:Cu+-exporting ATPase